MILCITPHKTYMSISEQQSQPALRGQLGLSSVFDILCYIVICGVIL
jgi:hypothetical protein